MKPSLKAKASFRFINSLLRPVVLLFGVDFVVLHALGLVHGCGLLLV
jgi:hypothetical protein